MCWVGVLDVCHVCWVGVLDMLGIGCVWRCVCVLGRCIGCAGCWVCVEVCVLCTHVLGCVWLGMHDLGRSTGCVL